MVRTRGTAARLEPRGHGATLLVHDSNSAGKALGGRARAAEVVDVELLEQAAKA